MRFTLYLVNLKFNILNLMLINIKKKYLPIDFYHEFIDKLNSFLMFIRLSKIEKAKIKYTVRIYDKGSKWSRIIKMQTPNQSGIWNNIFFKTYGKADIHIGMNDISEFNFYHNMNIKKWWIHTEPPSYIKLFKYKEKIDINQFDKIYTSSTDFNHLSKNVFLSPPYVFWYIGYSAYNIKKNFDFINYNFLFNLKKGHKENKLVVIASAVNDIPGHAARTNFITTLAKYNFSFEIWGSEKWKYSNKYKGFSANKLDTYFKSKYVLVIENDKCDYYWSEKFTDAILSYSIPIYYGCNNISDYFPDGSYIPIDIHDVNVFSSIQAIVTSNFYEKNFHNLIKARKIILEEQNFFAFIDSKIKIN